MTTPLPTVAAREAAAQAKPNDARATLSTNFDTFLRLLTTQLQNQDPTSPLDTNQFTQQLVQYSQVEQQIETNATLKKLVDAQSVSTTGAALGLLGRTVSVEGATADLAEDGARWTYTLPQNAAQATLIVRDAAGREVGRADAETRIGTHAFAWSGLNSDGDAQPPGAYSLEVRATGTDGAKIDAAITGEVSVRSLETNAAGVKLKTAAGDFEFSKILGVR